MKNHTYKSEITWHSFIAHTLLKYLKKHIYEFENTWDNFQRFKKSILTNLKISETIFKDLKKAYLRIWKYLRQFFTHTLFKYLKKHTCKSKNTWGSFLAHTLFKYLKKNILTNLKIPRTVFRSYPSQILQILKAALFILITI